MSKTITIACDHAGYDLKNALKKEILNMGFEVIDCGTNSSESVDYPDFAKLAEAFDAWGKVISSADEFRPALEEAFKQDGPALIGVPIDYAENMKLTKRLGELQFTI